MNSDDQHKQQVGKQFNASAQRIDSKIVKVWDYENVHRNHNFKTAQNTLST